MQTKLGFEGDHSFKKPTSAPDPKASFQQRAVITTVMGCSLLFWGGMGRHKVPSPLSRVGCPWRGPWRGAL